MRKPATKMCVSNQPWALIVLCTLFCPALLFSGTHSTPIVSKNNHNKNPCAHDSIIEVIRKSPIIVKALGAHIFTDDATIEELFATARAVAASTVNDDFKWQSRQNNFFTSATLQTSIENKKNCNVAQQQQLEKDLLATSLERQQRQGAATMSISASSVATSTIPANSAKALDKSILITLTPETIYKGASLLKMPPGRENSAHRVGDNGKGYGIADLGHSDSYGSGSGGSTTSESAYQYEGRLNATLQPLLCFDENLLKLLPTELIVFGKLINVQQQQHHQQQQLSNELHTTQQLDFLSISINGLHRWTPQFENHIWKHLGWDDWSDFTLCSVTCGKGVQQRFRRCLLDNPMVNFNMQLNLNELDNADDDNSDAIEDNDNNEVNKNVVEYDAMSKADINDIQLQNNALVPGFNGIASDVDALFNNNKQQQYISKAVKKSNYNSQQQKENQTTTNSTATLVTLLGLDTTTSGNASTRTITFNANTNSYKINILHKLNSLRTIKVAATPTTIFDKIIDNKHEVKEEKGIDEHKISMRTYNGNVRVKEGRFFGNRNDIKTSTKDNEKISKLPNNIKRRQHKRRKPTKNYSTMFCEGYNIEQRDCNIFECNDDINDLLKFYKKYPMPEDDSMQSSQIMPFVADSHTITTFTMGTGMTSTGVTTSSATATMNVDLVSNAATAGATSTTSTSKRSGFGSDSGFGSGSRAAIGGSFTFDGSSSASAFGSTLKIDETNTNTAAIAARMATTVANALPSTTPTNIGYIRSWRNTLNFTIMLTLRVRNESKTATTIFSIRNSTHNLYLESCKDGLRLYLERDRTTEMLPVKFNLYDYRWHQVAISIQNGDFISIYVDCSWTNSFVVSKRLYTLPLDSDVEIGRGFNGELQQLLVLPDNQEREQCSNKRTSINEVKRYIIDTFIGDYGN